MFEEIVGYEKVKEILIKSLKSTKPVNILLVGPVATGKTLFLLEIVSKVNGVRYTVGSSTTKAGLEDYLIRYKPSILVIDELDKMNIEDMNVLLSVMETGIVSRLKYGKTEKVRLNLRVYAAANSTKNIPKELLSRFEVISLPEYSEDEFKEVVVQILTKQEGKDEELAKHIAKVVWNDLASKDVREAIRLARLCENKEEVNELVSFKKKHESNLLNYI